MVYYFLKFSFCFVILSQTFIHRNIVAQDQQGHQSDWYYNPFNQNSAHHRPIGTGAIYAEAGDPAVQNWLKGSQINMNVGTTPWGLYMVDADENGPVLTVNKRQATGTNGLPADMRFPSGGVDIDFPSQFDGNITVYDRTINVFNHLRVYTWNDGSPLAMQYRRYEANSVGHGSKIMERTGTSASGVAAPFGILRGWEVEETGHPIGHALQIVLPGMPSTPAMMMLGRDVWWPAVSMDGWVLTDPTRNTGNIPYGSLWAIPSVEKGGPDLSTLGLTEKGMRLAEAIRDYGMYVVDNGGAPSIRCDQDFTSAVRTELVNETKKFYSHIRMVINSVPEEGKMKFNMGDSYSNPTGGLYTEIIPGEFPAGGGTPLAPNTAIDAVTSSHKQNENPGNSFLESIRIYPNPSGDKITIQHNGLSQDVRIDVFNMLGQVVLKSQIHSGFSTNIKLPEGKDIYFVRVLSGSDSKTIKVVKL